MNLIITGISRGIGLELTRQALTRGDRVLGIARNPDAAPGLPALREQFRAALEIVAVDLSHPDSIGKVVQAAERTFGARSPLDGLIGNAGVYLEDDLSGLEASFRVNAIAPHLLARALLPELKRGRRPRVLQLTSLMGSIADNGAGGSYSYRASKAALNMLTHTLAMDERWLVAAVVHPGWVQTEMGGKQAPTPPEKSAGELLALFDQLEKKHSGRFFDSDGSELPW